MKTLLLVAALLLCGQVTAEDYVITEETKEQIMCITANALLVVEYWDEHAGTALRDIRAEEAERFRAMVSPRHYVTMANTAVEVVKGIQNGRTTFEKLEAIAHGCMDMYGGFN